MVNIRATCAIVLTQSRTHDRRTTAFLNYQPPGSVSLLNFRMYTSYARSGSGCLQNPLTVRLKDAGKKAVKDGLALYPSVKSQPMNPTFWTWHLISQVEHLAKIANRFSHLPRAGVCNNARRPRSSRTLKHACGSWYPSR